MVRLKLGLQRNLTCLCYCEQILIACPWCSFWDYEEVPVRNEQRCRMASRSATKELYKRWAAAVANFGCSGKPFDSNKQRFCSGAENSRITIWAAKWRQSGFEKNVVTGNGLPLVSTKKKRNAGSNNTIILIHGRGVDKALVAE